MLIITSGGANNGLDSYAVTKWYLWHFQNCADCLLILMNVLLWNKNNILNC